MFKTSIIPALAFVVGHTQTETKFDCYSNDVKVGTGSYKETFEKNGHKKSVFKIWGTDRKGGKRSIIQTKIIDKNAFPISEEEIINEGGSEVTLKVKYDDTGAAILTVVEDKTTIERSYVPIPGLSRADVSDLWFTKLHPSKNTTVTSTVFDIEGTPPKWQRIDTTYVGKKWITLSGHRIEVHEVKDVRDGVNREVYLDEKGQPVLMVNGRVRTEKHF